MEKSSKVSEKRGRSPLNLLEIDSSGVLSFAIIYFHGNKIAQFTTNETRPLNFRPK